MKNEKKRHIKYFEMIYISHCAQWNRGIFSQTDKMYNMYWSNKDYIVILTYKLENNYSG
jgi:hypothetical protein